MSSQRSSVTIALQITVLTALTHGMGTAGNEQILRVSEVLLPDEFGQLERHAVPEVSGAAMRATLREHAVGDYFELLGLEEGSISLDRLRLLLKGGKNDAGGVSVPLDEARRMRRLAPLLSLFGSMDGGFPVAGKLTVEPARVWCAELVNAGILPREMTPIQRDGESAEVPGIRFFPGTEPPPVHLAITRLQNFRHDLRTSGPARYLEADAKKGIEDRAAARALIAKPSKEERHAANESMPYAFQAITPGTPLLSILRLRDADAVDIAVLKRAIVRWIQHGAFLGGGSAAGRGACKVEIAGVLSHRPGVLVEPGTALHVAPDDPHSAPYLDHLRAVGDDARAWLCEDKAGVAAAKTEKKKGGKKAKGDDAPPAMP